MENIFKMVADSGLVGYFILGTGLVGLAMIIERTRVLFFDYSIKADDFMKQVKSLVMNDQIEEAITFCAANEKAPLAHVVKGILERADRDDESIGQGLDIALSEVIPDLGKRLGYLSMIANVATLMGLLGTIGGLIMAFSAVAFADPSQKQIVLAQGISMAMYTTFLGLSVAIPVMVAYSILHSKQSRLLEEISEYSAKIMDLLTTRHYIPFSSKTAFPASIAESDLEKIKPAPPSTTKVA